MTNKKNRFFTLVFSCCPGAGEMYMGLYKHGVSLLGTFCAIAAVAFWLNLEALLFVLPVIWCYSFFHTHNLWHMTEEAFAEVKDDFFFANYINCKPDRQLTEKHRHLMGVILLIVGISVLWKTGINLLGTFFYVPEFIWGIGYAVPQIVVAGFILYVAIALMKGKKEDVAEEAEEDFAEELQKEEEA